MLKINKPLLRGTQTIHKQLDPTQIIFKEPLPTPKLLVLNSFFLTTIIPLDFHLFTSSLFFQMTVQET